MTGFLQRTVRALLLGGVIVAVACFLSFDKTSSLKSFSDAFSIAAIILLTVAGMRYLTAHGAFLGLGFVLKKTREVLLPFIKKEEENYGEYRRKRTEKSDEESESLLPILSAGLFYLAIACALLVFYAR